MKNIDRLLKNFSLKKHFFVVFFLVAVIPVVVASILFYTFLNYEQKIREEAQKNYEQQAEFTVSAI